MVEGINRTPPSYPGDRIPKPNPGEDRLQSLISQCLSMKKSCNTQEMMVMLQELEEAARQYPELRYMIENTRVGLSSEKNWLESHPEALVPFFNELMMHELNPNHPSDI